MKRREIIFLIISILSTVSLVSIIILERWGLTVWGNIEDVNIQRSGTWGQIVSAIGATLAFIIALTNLIFQRTQYNAGEDRRKEEEETSVYIWINIIEEKNDNGEHLGWQYDLNVQNSTKFPISKWLVKFSSRIEHLCNFQKKPLIPGVNTFNLPFLDDNEPNTLPESEIFFESKMEIIWNRKSTGALKQVTSDSLACEHHK